MISNLNRFVFLFLLLCLFACEQKPAPTTAVTAPADFTGYTVQPIAGSTVQKAIRHDEIGSLAEEGMIQDGKKQGIWTTYYKDNGRVKTLTSYVNGMKNGPHLELNDRSQVTLQANYTNDQLDGRWHKFRFGSRIEKEVHYKMGIMDGYYREYHKNGKLMKEVPYTNGKIHGTFKQYNDDEALVMQYEYEMGEKVSGGIVDPPQKKEEQ